MEFLSTLDRDRIAELLDRDEYFWLDLVSPSEEDVKQLGEIFGFHKLAIEDTIKFGQRPKIDDYENYVFVVFYGVGPPADEQEPELVEVHFYISGSYVVTVRHGHCADLVHVREQLAKRQARSEEQVVYLLFDALTDSFFPVLTAIDDQIDNLEVGLIEDPQQRHMQRIQALRRQLVVLRRRLAPQRDLFARQMDQIISLPGLQTEVARDYFRDVYDHLLRAAEEIDSFRDLLSGLMDVYLSSVSNRLNAVMKQLTVLAAIFLPMTFITGFYGQNFGWLVRNVSTEADFLIFGVGGLIVPIILLLALFRARRWI